MHDEAPSGADPVFGSLGDPPVPLRAVLAGTLSGSSPGHRAKKAKAAIHPGGGGVPVARQHELTDSKSTVEGHRDLEVLYLEHADGLSGAIRGILGREGDVQDVLQQAFLKAWRAWQQGTRAEDPVAWLFVVAMNTARDHLRTRRRRPATVPLEEVTLTEQAPMQRDGTAAPAVGPERRMEHQEWLEAAKAAIHHLRDPEKEVFLLRVSGGCTFPVIAHNLGIPEGTAKTRMRTALGVLRRRLATYAPEDRNQTPEDPR